MNIRRVAIEGVELIGEDDSRGMPVGGSRSVRCILVVDDEAGQIVRVTVDNQGYLEHPGASAATAEPPPTSDDDFDRDLRAKIERAENELAARDAAMRMRTRAIRR